MSQGQQLWWSISLGKRAFVYKIWIMNRPECCFTEIPKLRVVLSNSEKTESADCKVYDWKSQLRRLMICKPSIMATNLTIFADEADDLTLCEVLITATGRRNLQLYFVFHSNIFGCTFFLVLKSSENVNNTIEQNKGNNYD